MDIVEWQQNERIMSRQEIDEFYETPLRDVTVFRFETAKLQMPEHHGAFSLKSLRAGRERYLFNGRSVALYPNQILLVNAGERYASEICELTESLSIFYRQFEFGAALRSLTDRSDALLANDTGHFLDDVAQIAFNADSGVVHTLNNLHTALDAGDESEAQEASMILLLSVIRQNRVLAPPTSLRSIKKRSTRDELLSRVLRARDFLLATQGQNVNLDHLANIACLSRYHFLRVFTEIVGLTPVAYSRQLRLSNAQKELRSGEDPIAVAQAAGYRSYGAFARAYKRHFATSPTSSLN